MFRNILRALFKSTSISNISFAISSGLLSNIYQYPIYPSQYPQGSFQIYTNIQYIIRTILRALFKSIPISNISFAISSGLFSNLCQYPIYPSQYPQGSSQIYTNIQYILRNILRALFKSMPISNISFAISSGLFSNLYQYPIYPSQYPQGSFQIYTNIQYILRNVLRALFISTTISNISFAISSGLFSK